MSDAKSAAELLDTSPHNTTTATNAEAGSESFIAAVYHKLDSMRDERPAVRLSSSASTHRGELRPDSVAAVELISGQPAGEIDCRIQSIQVAIDEQDRLGHQTGDPFFRINTTG